LPNKTKWKKPLTVKSSCPECFLEFNAPKKIVGTVVPCPKCGEEITIVKKSKKKKEADKPVVTEDVEEIEEEAATEPDKFDLGEFEPEE